MNEDVYPDYEAMSQAAAAHLMTAIKRQPDLLVCLATGSSPIRMYQIIAEAIAAKQCDVSQLRCIALDEWHGISQLHPSTCAAFIKEHIQDAWNLRSEQVHCFDASVENPQAECARIQSLLQAEGPIDVCILGLGRNGHLGLNEPAQSLRASVHVAELDALSQTHQMLADEGIQLKHGMTIGMADILASKEILMLMTGAGKHEVYKQLLLGEITTEIPASFLHVHRCVSNFIDQQIANN